MSAPHIHAKSSAKKFGGKPEEYLKFHEKMDCSQFYFPHPIHRVLTHTMFWVEHVMIPIFGSIYINSIGKEVPIKDICIMHILEDYHGKFIPTISDFLQEMEVKDWMIHGIKDVPPSAKKRFKNGANESDLKVKTTEFKD